MIDLLGYRPSVVNRRTQSGGVPIMHPRMRYQSSVAAQETIACSSVCVFFFIPGCGSVPRQSRHRIEQLDG